MTPVDADHRDHANADILVGANVAALRDISGIGVSVAGLDGEPADVRQDTARVDGRVLIDAPGGHPII